MLHRAALLAASVLSCAVALGEPLTGTLVVANKNEHSAHLIDLATREVVAQFPTAVGPHEAAVSPDGRIAVIAEYGAMVGGNTLRFLDIPSGTEIGRLDLREYSRPHGMAFTPDGAQLIVTSETKQAVVVVDVNAMRVLAGHPTDAKGSHMLALSPKGDRVYTTNVQSNSVSVIDLTKGELVGTVSTSPAPEAIALSPDGKFLWIGGRGENVLEVIDTATLTVVAKIDCPGLPYRLAFTPDGKRVLAACPVGGDVAVFDAQDRTLEARIPVVVPEDFEERLQPSPPGHPKVLPLGIIAPGPRCAFVTIANGAMALEIDLNERRVTRAFPAGGGPDGIAYSPARVAARD